MFTLVRKKKIKGKTGYVIIDRNSFTSYEGQNIQREDGIPTRERENVEAGAPVGVLPHRPHQLCDLSKVTDSSIVTNIMAHAL